MTVLSAEKFLRNKLENEIQTFGDGITEFHTRDLEHLLQCLDEKDETIRELKLNCADLIGKIDWEKRKMFGDLMTLVMTKNNLSAEERLNHIRSKYKNVWEEVKMDKQ